MIYSNQGKSSNAQKESSHTHSSIPVGDADFSQIIQLQRALGNKSVSSLMLQANPIQAPISITPNPSDEIQRKVTIKFQEPEHEMEDLDTSAAQIEQIRADRDSYSVSTEDQSHDKAQNAHVTSNVVFTSMFERMLPGKTWVQAWTAVKEQYQFLYDLLDQWYKQDDLRTGSNANTRNNLPGLIQAQIDNCDNELTRGGHPIGDHLWAARPIMGTPNDWKYYDHLPDQPNDGVDASTHIIKKWKPTLRDADVLRLANACEQWILLRGQIPWTSVDTGSYITGDAVGPRKVNSIADSYQAQANLSDAEAKEISDGIIITFDFFPPSFTAKRRLEHAAAVGARHLVEHFQYHKDKIKAAWRDKIKEQFLISWEEKIEDEKGVEEAKPTTLPAKKQNKKAARVELARKTGGLDHMETHWAALKNEFNTKYAEFVKAIK